MSDRPTPFDQTTRHDTRHSQPPLESPPPLPVSPGMQRALNEYATTSPTHPDALGGLLAPLIAQRAANEFLVGQLLGTYLSQSGLDIRDLQEVLPIMNHMTGTAKVTKGLAQLEYDLRRQEMTARDPMQRPIYNSKGIAWREKIPPGGEQRSTEDLLSAFSQQPPVSPLGSPGEHPATLPMSAASE